MDNSLEKDVAALRQEVATLRAESRRRTRLGWALGFVALAGASAWAQLVTFQADGPARASEVNGNFAQLQSWLEMKVGSVTDAGVVAGAVRSTTLTNTGALTTSTLSTTTLAVANGLPIAVGAEVELAVANADPESIVSLGAANGRRACFLVGYELHDTMANESLGRCFVEIATGNWQLRADVTEGGGDPDLICRARCLTW